MKKYICLLLVLFMLTNCLAGCRVTPTATPGATGESTTETSSEPSLEITTEATNNNSSDVKDNNAEPEISEESTLEWIGPQDNYPIEYLNFDENKYPQLKGFLLMEETSTNIPFEPVYTKKYIDNFPEGIVCNNNHVLAKINKVEKLKINDRYFLKYEYEIEKVYYGNLKKGDKVSVCMKDWTEKQDFIYLGGNPGVPYTSDFKNSITYPRVGQYIVTRVHEYEFKEEFYPNIKEKYLNYYNNALYKNELKLMEENYFVQSHIFNQMLFDENKNLISTGAVMLNAFRKYKNNESATIEKFSDADEFINYFFVERE